MKRYLLRLAAIVFLLPCMAFECGDDESPPVDLVRIEVFNFNNEKEGPFQTAEPVKKEAYMLGIKWFVTYPWQKGSDSAGSFHHYHDTEIGNVSQMKIFCNEPFDEAHPAGSDVTGLFKKAIGYSHDMSMRLVLLRAPEPGTHSFRVVYYLSGEDAGTVQADTEPLELY